MTGFKNDDGLALVALFLDDSGWPDPDDSIFATVAVPIRDGRAFAELETVPAGSFAVSVFHDTNGNRILDAKPAHAWSADLPETKDYQFHTESLKVPEKIAAEMARWNAGG